MPLSPLVLLGTIKAEIAANYRLASFSSDADIAELITYARALGMDDELTHDMVCTANRKGKPIPVPAMRKQMEDYIKVVKPRDYPFGFRNLQTFQEFQTEAKTVLHALNIPTGRLRVHGSSLRKRDAQDLDLLAIATEPEFRRYQGLLSPQLKAFINDSLRDLATRNRLGAIDLLLVEDGTYFPNRPYLDFS